MRGLGRGICLLARNKGLLEGLARHVQMVLLTSQGMIQNEEWELMTWEKKIKRQEIVILGCRKSAGAKKHSIVLILVPTYNISFSMCLPTFYGRNHLTIYF